MPQRNNRLLQLIRDNLDAPRRLEVKAEGDSATLYLYDAIDPYWGIAAKDFVQALNGITAPTVHLRINSPGGDVFEARAIAAAIQQHKSDIISHVDGLAASAATYIAIAGKEVEMAPGSFFMIHNAWAIAIGNSDDMLQMADLLDKVDGSIAADYAKKTGKSLEELAGLMAAETWFTADEAKAAGFADRVAGEDAADANALWNLAAYRNVPKALRERKRAPAPAQQFDRDALERRLAMYEKGSQHRIAA